ncbi:hypothetical protein CHLRE_13g579050v5 [Chlamydomonas reinhardtii]|uniref:Uncharacterized protein n=1 Tax=Chlamydomonas reinhardtii TaxID=3055 RepID=A0A2K3D092_CHLRE|nr:uncharacterized protein CHLRE_13g579050v5 [Chlamydomonas reinhardtii]PNW73941.1 hypothetical protein CHLRE_13g579050v5 [Chlamydomonas reinhardtii]
MLRSTLSRGNAASQRPVAASQRPALTKAAAALSAAKAMQHQSAAVPRLGGSARSVVAAAAAAAAADRFGEEEIAEVLAAIPPQHHATVFKLFWKLMAQIIAKNQALAAKADELTAMAKDYAAMAKDNATKTEQLYTTKQQLLFALSAAGVFNARSFVEYVANQWRQEQAGGSAKKRQDVFKDGLRTRPDLVLCLLRDVPSWTPASMTDEQKVESMAANLEAIMQDASNDVHSFNTASGLILHRDVHNRPTVASLSCIARSMGVPCHIKEEKEDNDATSA